MCLRVRFNQRFLPHDLVRVYYLKRLFLTPNDPNPKSYHRYTAKIRIAD